MRLKDVLIAAEGNEGEAARALRGMVKWTEKEWVALDGRQRSNAAFLIHIMAGRCARELNALHE